MALYPRQACARSVIRSFTAFMKEDERWGDQSSRIPLETSIRRYKESDSEQFLIEIRIHFTILGAGLWTGRIFRYFKSIT